MQNVKLLEDLPSDETKTSERLVSFFLFLKMMTSQGNLEYRVSTHYDWVFIFGTVGTLRSDNSNGDVGLFYIRLRTAHE